MWLLRLLRSVLPHACFESKHLEDTSPLNQQHELYSLVVKVTDTCTANPDPFYLSGRVVWT